MSSGKIDGGKSASLKSTVKGPTAEPSAAKFTGTDDAIRGGTSSTSASEPVRKERVSGADVAFPVRPASPAASVKTTLVSAGRGAGVRKKTERVGARWRVTPRSGRPVSISEP